MDTEAPPDELPLLALGRQRCVKPGKGTERHGNAALVRKVHRHGIGAEGKVVDAKFIHGSGLRGSYITSSVLGLLARSARGA